MDEKKTEGASVCARERLTKGCYRLSSLTLAKLSCARKYKANYKPITQMDISGSAAPWVVQTGKNKWLTNERMKDNGPRVKRKLDWKHN